MKMWIVASAIAVPLVAAAKLTLRGAEPSPEHRAPERLARHVERSVWDSVFTTAQAARGDSIYKAGCKNCHGDALQGGSTPDFGDSKPLVGEPFMGDYQGQTLADLYDKIFNDMPANKPKTLDKQVIVDVMAHILNQNHFPAGPKELVADHDQLNDVKIVPAKPAAPPN